MWKETFWKGERADAKAKRWECPLPIQEQQGHWYL